MLYVVPFYFTLYNVRQILTDPIHSIVQASRLIELFKVTTCFNTIKHILP